MDNAQLDELDRATGALIMLFLDGENEGQHGGGHHDEDCPVCKVIADAQAALISAARRPEPTDWLAWIAAHHETMDPPTNPFTRSYRYGDVKAAWEAGAGVDSSEEQELPAIGEHDHG